MPLKYIPVPVYVPQTNLITGVFPATDKKNITNSTLKYNPKMTDKTCVEIIYNQIKNASCYKKTEKLLKDTINKDNVIGILKEYKNIKKSALSNDIDHEFFLDYETVKEVIVKPLIQKAKELKKDLKSLPSYDELKNINQVNEFIIMIIKLIENEFELDNNQKLAQNLQQQYARPNFKPNDYELGNLKQKYPEPRYKVEENDKNSIIIVTKNNIMIKQIFKNKNNNGINYEIYEYDDNGNKLRRIEVKNDKITELYIYNTPGNKKDRTTIEYYDGKIKYLERKENGHFKEYEFNDNGNLYDLESIVNKLKLKSLASKMALKEISKNNILRIMSHFNYTYKEDFCDFIRKNKYLSFDEKKYYLKKFEYMAMDAAGFDKNYKSNTKISNK